MKFNKTCILIQMNDEVDTKIVNFNDTIDQSKPYDSKKNCWVPDEKEGYLLGEIKATKGDIVSVGLPGGEVIQIKSNQTNSTIKSVELPHNYRVLQIKRFYNFHFLKYFLKSQQYVGIFSVSL